MIQQPSTTVKRRVPAKSLAVAATSSSSTVTVGPSGISTSSNPSVLVHPTLALPDNNAGLPVSVSMPVTGKERSQQTIDNWYRSKNTTKAYAGYVRAGFKWVEAFTDATRFDLDGSQATLMDPEQRMKLRGALETPGEWSPMALRAFIASKCDYDTKKYSTAEGIRAAFKNYWEQYVFDDCFLNLCSTDFRYLGHIITPSLVGRLTRIYRNGGETLYMPWNSKPTLNR